jgi:hypothetical protein
MNKLEMKQGSFIQQTQYCIPVEIDLSVVPAHLGISDFFTCPIGQPKYKIYLSDVSFRWYWTIGQTLMSRPVATKSMFIIQCTM